MSKKEKNISSNEDEFEIVESTKLTDKDFSRKRLKKTKAAISCFILLLAVGVMGNWYWENSDISSKVSTISNAKEKILGEATYVDATTEQTTESNYFSSARVDRQSARDESLEKLQKIVDSQSENADAQKEAADKISKISDNITIENKIETLVTAKGVNNCLAVINDTTNKIDIIVDVEDLTDTIILQIKEIATSQLGCSFEDVTIIQSNSK